MNFAVVKFGGKQHLVTEGQTLEVEGRMADKPGSLDLTEILLLNVDDKLTIGSPLISGAKITAKITGIGKGDKIEIYKFKAKSRYRKHTGFRPFVTTLEIGNFSGQKAAPAAKPSEPKKAAKQKK